MVPVIVTGTLVVTVVTMIMVVVAAAAVTEVLTVVAATVVQVAIHCGGGRVGTCSYNLSL